MKITIATSSLNRIDLLTQMKFDFESIAPDFEEIINPKISNIQNIENLALGKALSVQEKIQKITPKNADPDPDYCIFGFDSMVVFEKRVIGKPRDKKDAEKMLTDFIGKSQQIVTGIACVAKFEGKSFQIVEHESTDIVFKKNIKKSEIQKYLDFEDWSGKCGAYSILGTGIFLIESLQGDFQNIVGVPVIRMGNILKKITGENILNQLRKR